MDKVREALEDLFAMVQGEVPSLLEDHHLFDKITEALATDNWQDISTAPKDDTEFIAYLSNGWVTVMRGNFDSNSRYAWWSVQLRLSIPYTPSHPKDIDWASTYTVTATHWQPLPNPPKKIGE